MEQAINKFLQRLEKQEKKGFNDLATLLSQLSKPAQWSARSRPCLWPRLWRLIFSQHWTKIRPICSPVGVAPFPTRSGPQVTNPGYPGLSQFIWCYPWVTPDFKHYSVFRWTVEVRRGVTRPVAAARQQAVKMNGTYGMPVSISQDNSVSNYYPDTGKSGYLIPTYPWICKSRNLIPTYPGLSQSTNPIYETYIGISRDILTCPGPGPRGHFFRYQDSDAAQSSLRNSQPFAVLC